MQRDAAAKSGTDHMVGDRARKGTLLRLTVDRVADAHEDDGDEDDVTSFTMLGGVDESCDDAGDQYERARQNH